jgi:hypothetical protein
MRSTNLALKNIVSSQEIEHVLSLRSIYDSIKKRLELAENAMVQAETEVTDRIQSGATVCSDRDVQVRSIERKSVPWKSVVSSLIGHERTEAILTETAPSISLRLLIK